MSKKTKTKGGGSSTMIIIVVVVIILAGVAGFYFFNKNKDTEKEEKVEVNNDVYIEQTYSQPTSGNYSDLYVEDVPIIPEDEVNISTNKRCGPEHNNTRCPGKELCNQGGHCGLEEIFDYPPYSQFSGPQSVYHDSESPYTKKCGPQNDLQKCRGAHVCYKDGICGPYMKGVPKEFSKYSGPESCFNKSSGCKVVAKPPKPPKPSTAPNSTQGVGNSSFAIEAMEHRQQVLNDEASANADINAAKSKNCETSTHVWTEKNGCGPCPRGMKFFEDKTGNRRCLTENQFEDLAVSNDILTQEAPNINTVSSCSKSRSSSLNELYNLLIRSVNELLKEELTVIVNANNKNVDLKTAVTLNLPVVNCKNVSISNNANKEFLALNKATDSQKKILFTELAIDADDVIKKYIENKNRTNVLAVLKGINMIKSYNDIFDEGKNKLIVTLSTKECDISSGIDIISKYLADVFVSKVLDSTIIKSAVGNKEQDCSCTRSGKVCASPNEVEKVRRLVDKKRMLRRLKTRRR